MSSVGPGFILNGHSEAQLQLLQQLDDSQSSLLYVEGPHRIWINKSPVHYFSLRLTASSDSGHTGEGTYIHHTYTHKQICENVSFTMSTQCGGTI